MTAQYRRLFLILAAVVALVLAALVVRELRRSSRGASAIDRAGKASPVGQVLSTNASQLITLLRMGEGLTVHATYQVVGDPAKVGNASTIELWQQPPRVREDTVRQLGTQTVHTISLQLPSGQVLCTQRDNGPWTCARQPAAQASPAGAAGLLATVPSQLAGRTVTTRRDTVNGRKVQCFAAAPLELCATDSGVPALIRSPDVRYQLTNLDTTVSDTAFVPPVPPT
jgi:hypothetical protein